FRRHGLVVVDVERIPLHGGSLRVTAAREGSTPPGQRVRALLAEEERWGVGRLESYEGFARRVEALKADLRNLLGRLAREGKRVVAYGASAKGSTLLNYFGIGRETLE